VKENKRAGPHSDGTTAAKAFRTERMRVGRKAQHTTEKMGAATKDEQQKKWEQQKNTELVTKHRRGKCQMDGIVQGN